MTRLAIAQTALSNRDAGLDLGDQIMTTLGERPDALIVFASPTNDHASLLQALAERTGTEVIVGCTSAGEFTTDQAGQGLTNVTAIRSTSMRFSACLGRGLSSDAAGTAKQIVDCFSQASGGALPFRSALVLVDALAGHIETLVDAMTLRTAGTYRFFGGGAGDDARFQQTHVFCGTEVHRDAAVALEIASAKPIGIGARHGWRPASAPLRVTEADSAHIVSLNAQAAVDAFGDHATNTSQRFDPNDPMPFFLHNIVGVETAGGHKLRVPLGIADDGGVVCAAEVPAGVTTHIMSTGGSSAAEAASEAARDAMLQVTSTGGTPTGALFFDCVATRLRLGQEFQHELDALSRELHGVPFAGFNSYGQIVRADGQFSGFHNCTAVVCVFPE